MWPRPGFLSPISLPTRSSHYAPSTVASCWVFAQAKLALVSEALVLALACYRVSYSPFRSQIQCHLTIEIFPGNQVQNSPILGLFLSDHLVWALHNICAHLELSCLGAPVWLSQ